MTGPNYLERFSTDDRAYAEGVEDGMAEEPTRNLLSYGKSDELTAYVIGHNTGRLRRELPKAFLDQGTYAVCSYIVKPVISEVMRAINEHFCGEDRGAASADWRIAEETMTGAEGEDEILTILLEDASGRYTPMVIVAILRNKIVLPGWPWMFDVVRTAVSGGIYIHLADRT